VIRDFSQSLYINHTFTYKQALAEGWGYAPENRGNIPPETVVHAEKACTTVSIGGGVAKRRQSAPLPRSGFRIIILVLKKLLVREQSW